MERHRWRIGRVQPASLDDECEFCGLKPDGGPMGTGLQYATACLVGTTELISPDVLTQITEDLWVNPAQVVRVIASGSYTWIALSVGEPVHVDKSIHEVVALINGSA